MILVNDTLRSFSKFCGAIATVLLYVSCQDHGSTTRAQIPPEHPADDPSKTHLAAIKLVVTLTLTRPEREKFMDKLVREMGEETGAAFYRAIDSQEFREDLAELYSRTFNHRELSDLTAFSKNSRIVRLSLLTAPHTLSRIPGMGRKIESDKDTKGSWDELKREVEFFDINTIEEFEEESEALQDWDTQPFVENFENLKTPLIKLINRHFADVMR